MPRDGSGNYTLPSGNPVVTGTLIESAWANPTMADIAVQLNNVITRDGLLGPTNPFKLVDGAVATPGLAFNSEPGLGLYRPGTNVIRFAAVNANTAELNAATALSTNLSIYPRTTGVSSSRLTLSNSALGSANRSDFVINASTTVVDLFSDPYGTGTSLPLHYWGSAHEFYPSASFNYSAKFAAAGTSGIRLTLNKDAVAGSVSEIFGTRGALSRWSMSLGDATAEAGSNVGSDFYLNRYTDAGSFVDAPIKITRNDGTVILNTRLLNVVNAVTPFASGMSVATGSPGVTTPLTVINGNFEYHSNGFTGAVGTGAAWFYGDLNFPNTATPGRLIMAPNKGATWNTYYTASTTKVVDLFDTSPVPSYGFTMTASAQHNPGVAAAFAFSVGGAGFSMSNSGQGSSSGGWVATSDGRNKINRAPITDAMTKINTLSGQTYNKTDMLDMQGNAPRKAGYIAQEVQAVLPEAITVADDEMGTLSVDHNAVIGLLIEGMKELYAELHPA